METLPSGSNSHHDRQTRIEPINQKSATIAGGEIATVILGSSVASAIMIQK